MPVGLHNLALYTNSRHPIYLYFIYWNVYIAFRLIERKDIDTLVVHLLTISNRQSILKSIDSFIRIHNVYILYNLLCVAQKLSNRNVAMKFIESKNRSSDTCIYMIFIVKLFRTIYDFFYGRLVKSNDIVSSVWGSYLYGLIVGL